MTMWAQTAGKASTEANADPAAFDAALLLASSPAYGNSGEMERAA
jgi:hypothetical protein